jgi:two-component sensor histidine kinase
MKPGLNVGGNPLAEELKAERMQKISAVVLVAVPETGLNSLAKVFRGLPGGLDAAYVVAVPGYSGSTVKLRDSIAETSGLSVKVVKQEDGLEPDIVHILPSDRVATLKKSRFALEQKPDSKGLVDSFLLSLASDQGEKAVGVILSGLNDEGARGLSALKAAGGLALAELVDGVAPHPANVMGIADCLLPAEEIAQRLVDHLARLSSIAMGEEHVQRIEAELRLTKEKLRTTNEELQAVNGELAQRHRERSHTNGHLMNLLESTQIATIFLDNEFRIRNFTPAVAEIFHLIDSDIGRPIVKVAPRIAYGHLQEDVGKVLRTFDIVEREVEDPVKGSRHLVRVLPCRTIDNVIAGVVLTFTNITATAARAENVLTGSLLAELQHRVKNILAVVRSLANRTAENSENLEDFRAHFEGRLGAMGRTQNILTRTAGSGVDLAELVHEELVGQGAHFDEQVDVQCPEINLRAKPAESLCLAIHELATNAVKYGALSTRSGHINVTWGIDDVAGDPRLMLEWQESGVPVMNQKPHRNGFGRELIERGLPYELKATTTLEFRRGGIRCVIGVPLNDGIIVREKN